MPAARSPRCWPEPRRRAALPAHGTDRGHRHGHRGTGARACRDDDQAKASPGRLCRSGIGPRFEWPCLGFDYGDEKVMIPGIDGDEVAWLKKSIAQR
jgi:hypothetical protein